MSVPDGRITLVISTLGCGGAEKVLTLMANHWAAAGVQVTVVTIDSAHGDFYRLDSGVRRVALDLLASAHSAAGSVVANVGRVLDLRGAILGSRPNVVISFMDTTSILALLATRLTRVPVIVSERTDPRQRRLGAAWEYLRRWLYPKASALVVQTEAVSPYARRMNRGGIVEVIPNPVVAAAAHTEHALAPAHSGGAGVPPAHTVIAVGRLIWHKGFDMLLKAFGQCSGAFPEWRLVILGEGDERAQLESQAAELGIADRCEMPGRVENPDEVMSGADLFVMTSLFEGFPNALCEAMACGLPVISFDCPSGPSEIIRDGVDGLLVPLKDVDALERAMRRLMGSGEEREAFGARARQITDRFSMESVMGKWNALLESITHP